MPKPCQIVETITADTMAELIERRDRPTVAAMHELRLDYVRDVDVAGALKGRRLPAIVTCRASWEGGRFAGSEEERFRILNDAIALGAEYVDVEFHAGRRTLVRPTSSRLVVSHHDFQGMPPALPDLIRAMRATGADIVK